MTAFTPECLLQLYDRRYSPLATMLRSRTLVDVDCWSEAKGQPIKPGTICEVVRRRLKNEEQ